jgi:3-methyl-2-oxobutanoate hydroxymethyltransferase
MTPSEKIFPGTLRDAADRGQRIAMVTAYDAPSARLADRAGVDAILVGDSAAMTVLGLDSTVGITMDEMLMLTRAVSRGARRPLLVADLPFGAYQVSNDEAVRNAIRLVKDATADAVKVEGAGTTIQRVGAIVSAGVPVMGHLGLTPQTATMLGGYLPQGRTADAAHRILAEAQDLERAGCFAIVLEAVPPEVAARVTGALQVPTIGIGSGANCDGQVLVWHDLLGPTDGRVPRFVKQYADLGERVVAAIHAYVADVRAGTFPDDRHTYRMLSGELPAFQRATDSDDRGR